MGAWGHGSFENDGACDWIAELEADGIEAIREALQPRAHAYIEVDDASNGSGDPLLSIMHAPSNELK